MDLRQQLLWIDGTGGAVVGVVVVAFHGWLSDLYGLPRDFLLIMGIVNLAYGSYSLSLARRRHRPMMAIKLLAVANLAWGVACLRWTYVYADSASVFGLGHLLMEGLYVGGLGCTEWRWRHDLLQAK